MLCSWQSFRATPNFKLKFVPIYHPSQFAEDSDGNFQLAGGNSRLRDIAISY